MHSVIQENIENLTQLLLGIHEKNARGEKVQGEGLKYKGARIC